MPRRREFVSAAEFLALKDYTTQLETKIRSMQAQLDQGEVNQLSTEEAMLRLKSELLMSRETIAFLQPNFEHFFHFKGLPLELRLMVWDIIAAHDETPRDVVVQFNTGKFGCRARTWTPVLLQVNKETRAFALKRYTLAFKLKSTEGQPDSVGIVPFNFSIDTLVFANSPRLTTFAHYIGVTYSADDFAQLQHVMISSRTFLYGRNEDLLTFFKKLPALKTLTLLHGSVPRDRAPQPRKYPSGISWRQRHQPVRGQEKLDQLRTVLDDLWKRTLDGQATFMDPTGIVLPTAIHEEVQTIG